MIYVASAVQMFVFSWKFGLISFGAVFDSKTFVRSVFSIRAKKTVYFFGFECLRLIEIYVKVLASDYVDDRNEVFFSHRT